MNAMDTIPISKKYLAEHLLRDKGMYILNVDTGIVYTPDDILDMNQEEFYVKLGAGSKLI